MTPDPKDTRMADEPKPDAENASLTYAVRYADRLKTDLRTVEGCFKARGERDTPACGRCVLCLRARIAELEAWFNASQGRVRQLEEAIEMVLLYHAGGAWDATKSKRWERWTGQSEGTTRALCDQLRSLRRSPADAPTPREDVFENWRPAHSPPCERFCTGCDPNAGPTPSAIAARWVTLRRILAATPNTPTVAGAPQVWFCKIGGMVDPPWAADSPFRMAVERAYREMFGKDPDFCFTGWGGRLTATERELIYPRAAPAREGSHE
jgi:hypothetical protein